MWFKRRKQVATDVQTAHEVFAAEELKRRHEEIARLREEEIERHKKEVAECNRRHQEALNQATVLLNGKLTKYEEVDLAKHKYIGMFRRPFVSPAGYVMCACGSTLQTIQSSYEHYQAGHWDTPQYADINGSE